LREAPEVDRGRVESVRERLAAGTYAVDADRLAQRLLRFEQDLV